MAQRLLGLLTLGFVLGLAGCAHVAGICDCGRGNCCNHGSPAVIAPEPVPPPAAMPSVR